MPKKILDMSLIRVFQIALSGGGGEKIPPTAEAMENFIRVKFFYLVLVV